MRLALLVGCGQICLSFNPGAILNVRAASDTSERTRLWNVFL